MKGGSITERSRAVNWQHLSQSSGCSRRWEMLTGILEKLQVLWLRLMAEAILQLADFVLHAGQLLSILIQHLEQIFLIFTEIYLFLVVDESLGQLHVLCFLAHVLQHGSLAGFQGDCGELGPDAFL